MTSTSPKPANDSEQTSVATANSPFLIEPPDTTKMTGKLSKLAGSLLANSLAIYIIWGGASLFLNRVIQDLVGIDNVEVPYGMVVAVGSGFALVAQPIAGALSDRTRSRFGRRAPWMIGGAIIGGLSMVLLAIVSSMRLGNPDLQIPLIAVAWVLVQVSYNFVQGPMTAVFPDRVPVGVRGVFSGILGLGMMVGSLGGSIYASAFITSHLIPIGFLVLGIIALVITVLFVILNPDKSAADLPREPFHLGRFIKDFWISPRQHPDFWWALIARFLLMLGYFGVMLFQITILQKYVQPNMSPDEAAAFTPVLSVVSLVGTVIMMPLSGRLSDHLGRRKVFVIAASLVLGASLIVPLFMPTTTGLIIYSAIAGIGFGSYMAVDQALITEVLPSSKDAARDLGIINIAATLPQVMAPAIAGFIAAAFGYPALFVFGIVFAVLGSVAILPIKSVR